MTGHLFLYCGILIYLFIFNIASVASTSIVVVVVGTAIMPP